MKAAVLLGAAGKKVGIVNNELGGECLNWGCIPTKTLLWTTELFEKISRSHSIGLEVEAPRINFEMMMKRKTHVVNMLGKGVELNLARAKVTLIQGNGEIIAPNEINVERQDGNHEIIDTEHIIIATGSSPAWLPGTEKSGNILDNRGILYLNSIPESLIIVGGGVIGCEYASLFSALGTKVTLIEYADRLLPNEDHEISDFLQKIFTRKKIDVHVKTKVTALKECGDHVEVTFENASGEISTLTGAKALMAVGRLPRIPSYKNIDLSRTARGITTNEQMQTSTDNIYAIGDVAGKALLAYTAEREGEIAAHHILGKQFHLFNYHHVPNAIFCEPSIASIGLTETQAKNSNLSYVIGKSSYGSNAKSLITGDREGIVKLIFETKGKRFIGAHIIGHGAPECIALFSLVANKNCTLSDLQEMIFPHPVVAEVIKEAIENVSTV